MELSKTRHRTSAATVTDPKILIPAIGDAFKKLDPRVLIRNPVMFVVEVVATLTTILFIRDLFTGVGNYSFSFQINLWLWFTVLFANFAEAVAEGRGKAQAAALRQTKTDAVAKLLDKGDATPRLVPATALTQGDIVLVEAGDLIPSDGDVSKASPRSTKRRSPANPRPSSARAAATARRSRAARPSFPTGSR